MNFKRLFQCQIAGVPKIIIDEALKQHKKISEMKTFRGCNR